MRSPWALLPARDERGRVLAVVEASSESRSKFKFEPKLGVFQLESLLPTGTAFPHSFGFIPSTRGQDDDPIDIVVLSDEPPPVGTIVPCRLVAILTANQDEEGETIRNDRLLGVAECSERYHKIRHKSDVEPKILERIAQFFAFYHKEKGKTFVPLGWKGRATAERALELGEEAFAKPNSKAKAPSS